MDLGILVFIIWLCWTFILEFGEDFTNSSD